jgi:hypothetical protein
MVSDQFEPLGGSGLNSRQVNQKTVRMGIPSIVYDLTRWDFRVGHSGVQSLDITVTKNDEELADVSFSDEDMKIYRRREFTPLEEQEFQLFLDDLLWEDEFSEFAHLSTIQVEYRNANELVRMINEKYKDDLLYIRYNEQEEFMGYIEEVSLMQINGSQALVCYFTPIDEGSEIIRTDVFLKPEIKAIAAANSLMVEGVAERLEISRHVEHIH